METADDAKWCIALNTEAGLEKWCILQREQTARSASIWTEYFNLTDILTDLVNFTEISEFCCKIRSKDPIIRSIGGELIINKLK